MGREAAGARLGLRIAGLDTAGRDTAGRERTAAGRCTTGGPATNIAEISFTITE